MALLRRIIAIVIVTMQSVFAAHIGITDNGQMNIKDEEIDRSLVPMIRLPKDSGGYQRPTSAILDPEGFTTKQIDRYSDNGLRPESEIKPIVRPGRTFSDLLKRHRTDNLASRVSKFGSEMQKHGLNGIIAFQDETEPKSKKIIKVPLNDGSCFIDGNKVMNSEEIYENDCGKLQCINSEVIWMLKPLAKGLPRCEGMKAVPSMYASYAKIRILDDDVEHFIATGTSPSETRPDIDIVDQRKKHEEASRKMVEAEHWD